MLLLLCLSPLLALSVKVNAYSSYVSSSSGGGGGGGGGGNSDVSRGGRRLEELTMTIPVVEVDVQSTDFRARATATYAKVLPCLTRAWMLHGRSNTLRSSAT